MTNKNQYKPQSVSHPGETLEEKLKEMGMGTKEFAVGTDKPEKTIIAVMKGESSITADMAVLFEGVTKIPAHFWLNSQQRYDKFVTDNNHKTMNKRFENNKELIFQLSFRMQAMIRKE